MVNVLPFRTFLAIGFLIALLYVRSTSELQPLFLIPTVILAGAAACFLWKRVARTSLFCYASHAGALCFVWMVYWLYRDELLVNRATSPSTPIALYVCIAFFTLLCLSASAGALPAPRKWAAVALALYPVCMIIVTPPPTENPNQNPVAFQFGSVVAKIEFNSIASLPYETYRYYTSTRTVSISDPIAIGSTFYTNLKLQSVYLRVDADLRKPNSAVIEVIGQDGQVRYASPRSVHFDSTSFVPEGETIDGELVIISHDGNPYAWDVFYLLPSASHTPDNRRADNQGSNE